MTVREASIRAMRELEFSEAKIASILHFMDTHEPHCIAKCEQEIQPELELECIEIARDYFRLNNDVPSNN